LKIFGADGYKLSDELEEKIETFILSHDLPDHASAPGHIGKATRIEDARGRYIEFAKHTADNISLHGLKIVIDCGHGAAYFVAPLIFRELGAEVITTGIQPDGKNINEGCGALHPEAAGALVKQHGADLGVSFDGDADRCGFVDETGSPVSMDLITAVIAREVLRRAQVVVGPWHCVWYDASPHALERVLGELPGVGECAAFGIPDERLGELLVAVVRGEGLGEQQVKDWVGERLARYKAPGHVAFTADGLPRNHVGKVEKVALRAAWPKLYGEQ
jgi:hypothetical protein